MRKHGGTPSRRDKHVTLAAISPPGVARGRFVGGQQSGLAGSKPPPLLTREASSCSSQGRRQGEPWGASPRPSAPTYLPEGATRQGGQGQGNAPTSEGATVDQEKQALSACFLPRGRLGFDAPQLPPTWRRSTSDDPYFGLYEILSIDGHRIGLQCSPRLGRGLVSAAQQLKRYYNPEVLCGEKWE